ncbi:MAG: hypothetical protein Q4D38_07510 [Planctomycetia bacterium]|nr:hypothetical protein [Planctomycetia bacterium]
MRTITFFLVVLMAGALHAQAPTQVPTTFGKLKLIQEVDCGATLPNEDFREFPSGASSVERILGASCRVLAPSDETTKYFAVRIGKGCGLTPGKPYLLCVEFPEDKSRSMFIHNGGNEAISGVATGETTGDVLAGRYVNHNPESLQYPLSGKMSQWTGLFYLHDRFAEMIRPRGRGERNLLPEDGFWVTISQSYARNDPLSCGAAVAKVRLYEILEPEKLALEINYPPKNLPKRHIFWREEMADGVVDIGRSYQEEQDATARGVANPADWYEYKLLWARALGINTFCKDLLEFGHNQGWDAEEYGGNRWINQPRNKQLWGELVQLCKKYQFPILPYYEYCGSIGGDDTLSLGRQKRAKRLDGGDKYTHIWWSEKANVDLSDPDTLRDFEKILDCTVLRYKNDVEFLGVWLRPRVSANPVSFNERNIAQFSRDYAKKTVSRQDLQTNKELLQQYYQWWFAQRRAFLENVAQYLSQNGLENTFVLYTTDGGEPGYSIPWQIAGTGKKDSWRYKTNVVNDNMEKWERIIQENPYYEKRFVKAVDIEEVLEENWYADALKHWTDNWAGGENNHALPPADPENYLDSKRVMFSYTIHRTYSAADTPTMENYRTGAGLTCVRHYPLNEHELNVKGSTDKEFEPTGYFVADVERAGAFCMMPEVRAMAFGNPSQLGYLTGNTFQRGFPQYVRAFNAAYLALPALPSEIIQAAKYGKEYVHKISTPSDGDYYAVCSLEYTKKTFVIENLPDGTLVECATGKRYRVANGSVRIEMEPMSLRSFHME